MMGTADWRRRGRRCCGRSLYDGQIGRGAYVVPVISTGRECRSSCVVHRPPLYQEGSLGARIMPGWPLGVVSGEDACCAPTAARMSFQEDARALCPVDRGECEERSTLCSGDEASAMPGGVRLPSLSERRTVSQGVKDLHCAAAVTVPVVVGTDATDACAEFRE